MKKRERMSSKNASTKSFRMEAKHLFLTYPQCGVRKEIALQMLTDATRVLQTEIAEFLIAEEEHQDGTPHLHVYLEMKEKLRTRNPRAFDLEDSEGNAYHGNYQPCRSPSAVMRYCQKDGSWLASEGLKKKLSAKSEIWAKARKVAKEQGVSAALNVLEESGSEKVARDLCLYGAQLEKSFQELSPTASHTCARPLTDFALTWVWDQSRLLIIWGPTNVGKSTLACSLLPQSLLTRHLDLLASYTSTKYHGVVLDDMAFKHLHREAQIALADTHFTTQVHVRYKVATLPKGTPRILTTNRHPEEVFDLSDPAVARRIQTIHMEKDCQGGWAYTCGL